MTPLDQTIYVAPDGHLSDLLAELGDVIAVHGRLVFGPGPPRPAAWCHAVWVDPVSIPIASIKDGARALKGIQRNWHLHPVAHHRRATLIQAALPHVAAKPLVFPQPPPSAPLGAWTLIEPDRIIAAARVSSPFPDGEPRFVEDKEAPPNRAYLKLWEALTLAGRHPRPGDRCVDLGAAPGGWTWVLASLGAGVLSVDKAALDRRIASMPGVMERRMSAFALEPGMAADWLGGPVDWLVCDVVCYPGRLIRLIERWMAADAARNMICTVKFQGETDHAAARTLAAIPGATLRHLAHNKHELTWMRLATEDGALDGSGGAHLSVANTPTDGA